MKTKRFVCLFALLLVLAAFLTACGDDAVEKASLSLSFDGTRGTVTASAPAGKDGYTAGETVTVTVAPADGFVVTETTFNGSALTLTDGKATVTLAEGENTVAVTFTAREAERESATVTTVFDENRGDVTLSAPEREAGYRVGDTVTVTVAAKTHWVAPATLLVNGEDKPLTDGRLTLTLQKENTVTALFTPESLPFASLVSARGIAKFAGSYTYDVAGGDEYDGSFYIQTVYADGYIWNRESNSETGEIYYDTVYGKNKRNLTYVSHTLDNKIVETVSDAIFADYYNPFDLLAPEDFAFESEGVYRLTDADKAKAAASALTGWSEPIERFFLIVDAEGNAVAVDITTTLIERSEDISYVSTYHFDISEHGTATVPADRIRPYPHDESHDALKAAMEAAAAAPSYTIRHQGHEVGYVEPEGGETRPGYGDTDYRVYVRRGDLIYDAYKGEEHGFKQIGDYIYPFEFSYTGQLTLLDPVSVSGIDELSSDFLGFTPELFKYLGNGEYELHDTAVAPKIAPLFAEGYEKAQYSYAYNFKIVLKDNVLYQVIFTYKTYGIEETVTLTYDFSDLPAEAELDFTNATKYSVLTPYLGQYKDGEGHFCNVDKSGFTLNGTALKLVSYDTEQDVFYLDWDGVYVAITKLTQKQLLVTVDGGEQWTLDIIDDVSLSTPEDMRGTWEYSDDLTTAKIEIQEHVIRYNGNILRLLSSTEAEGVTGTFDDRTYNFRISTDKNGNKILTVLVVDKDLVLQEKFDATKTSDTAGIEIPTDFVGFYISKDGSVRVRITYEGIFINGTEFIPTAYADGTFTGTYNGVEGCQIMFGGSFGVTNKDQLVVIASSTATLDRTDSLNEKYIGTWESTDDEKTYVIVITETGVTVNGVSVTFRTNDKYGYELDIPGMAYTVYMTYYITKYGNESIVLYNDAEDENQLLVNLFRAADKVIGDDYVGVFEGTDKNGVAYRLEVSADGTVLLTVGDGAAVRVSDLSIDGDSDYSYLSFTVGGVKYTFFNTYTNDEYSLVSSAGSETVVDVTMTRASSFTVPAAYHGTWEGTGGGKTYRLEIAAGKIVLTIDGTAVEASTASGDDFEFTFTAGGGTYSISLQSYEVTKIMLACGGTYVLLSPVTA